MEMLISPARKRKATSDVCHVCFICKQNVKKNENYKVYTFTPTLDSLTKLRDCIRERYENAEMEFAGLFNEIKDLSEQDLSNQGISYHKKCYSSTTNKVMIERGKTRFEKGKITSDIAEIVNKSVGRPRKSTDDQDHEIRAPRQLLFDKMLCLFCQQVKKESLHCVETKNMGQQFLEIGKETSSDIVKNRLSLLVADENPLSAIAYDMKYHLICLVKNKRFCDKHSSTSKKVTSKSISADERLRLLADLEIIDIIRNGLKDEKDKVIDMNQIQDLYIRILQETGYPAEEKSSFKKYLKKLMLENIPDIHFNRPKNQREPEQCMSTRATQSAIEIAVDIGTITNDYKVILEAAKILRREITNNSHWQYKGMFDDFEIPMLLQTFCKTIIMGTRKIKTEQRTSDINKSSSILAQHIIQSYKTDRQTSYSPLKESSSFKSNLETPLSVGISLDLHSQTRSKNIVSKLKDIGISISYKKLMSIENCVANSIIEETKANDGVYLPPWSVQGKFTWFAIDNIDFLENTPSGMNTLHGTAIAMYQSQSENTNYRERVFKRTSSETCFDGCELPLLHCNSPNPKKSINKLDLNSLSPTITEKRNVDLAWVIGSIDYRILDEESNACENKAVGTWSAFNSLCTSNKTEITNIALLAPLIRSPPTDIDTLFTAIMRAGSVVRKVIGEGEMTVITFDMQLYDIAMRLWDVNDEIKEKFIFRPGELHVVFWALAALGKYIEASGIDQAWVEGGLFSPSTVTKLLNGKQLYRTLEAHTTTLLTFYQLYFKKFLDNNPDYKSVLCDISKELHNSHEESINSPNNNSMADTLSNVIKIFESCNILKKMNDFENSFTKQQIFIMQYIKQFETILSYIRATRERNFVLHLEATEALIKYFFAHDHLTYARLLPRYLSCMQDTQTNHPDVWQEFLNGNFCVTKSSIPFTSIAPDHALEQENRRLKVDGGITGITQNENALKRFFLIAPEIKRMSMNFEKNIGIYSMPTRTQHHEIHGSKLERLQVNKLKLQNVFLQHGDPFSSSSSDMCSLLTRAVLPDIVSKDLLNRDQIGQELFEKFVMDRLMSGNFSVWDPMKMKKLKTFHNQNTVVMKNGDKITKLKEERGLLQRFVIAARSRPNLDLKECIGTYEFGVIPRSLFSGDGSILLPNDKSTIMRNLEKLIATPTNENYVNESDRKVILFDGMELVNSIKKSTEIETCADFANAFLRLLIKKSEGFDEVHLIFDRYLEISLKKKMRSKRTRDKCIYYHVTDSTLIRYISLKDFLSDIRTKGELCEYLSKKALHHSKSTENKLKDFLVTYGTETFGNIEVNENLKIHNHEEADTILLLHAFSLDSDCELVVQSPDTDVLILLVSMYQKLPTNTFFKTGKGDKLRLISIGKIYHTLGEKRSSALLGLHAFTGTDVTGKFAGRSKDFCFKVFLICDDYVLDAFAKLGTDLSDDVNQLLERFVCLIYKSKEYTTVKELRWFLYSNREAEAESLPPTESALSQHIIRAHYISMIWRRACDNVVNLPTAESFGWEKDENGFFSPVRCKMPPAPKSVTELIKCKCNGCARNCSCRRNKIACTELCSCAQSSCCNENNKLGFDAFSDSDELI